MSPRLWRRFPAASLVPEHLSPSHQVPYTWIPLHFSFLQVWLNSYSFLMTHLRCQPSKNLSYLASFLLTQLENFCMAFRFHSEYPDHGMCYKALCNPWGSGLHFISESSERSLSHPQYVLTRCMLNKLVFVSLQRAYIDKVFLKENIYITSLYVYITSLHLCTFIYIHLIKNVYYGKEYLLHWKKNVCKP